MDVYNKIAKLFLQIMLHAFPVLIGMDDNVWSVIKKNASVILIKVVMNAI